MDSQEKNVTPRNATPENQSQEKTSMSRKELLNGIAGLLLIVLIIFCWYLPQFLPKNTYDNAIQEIRLVAAEHFFAERTDIYPSVSYADDFHRDMVQNRTRLDPSNDLQEGLLELIGFKKFWPIYRYEYKIPLLVSIPELDISGTAEVELVSTIQTFSHLGYCDVGTITYDEELYDTLLDLERAARLPISDIQASLLGDDTLVISYTWTNNTGDYACARWNIDEQVTQDHILLEEDLGAYLLDSGEFDFGSADVDIADGSSIVVHQPYTLYRSEGEVTLNLTPFSLFEEDLPTITQSFSLNSITPQPPSVPDVVPDSPLPLDAYQKPSASGSGSSTVTTIYTSEETGELYNYTVNIPAISNIETSSTDTEKLEDAVGKINAAIEIFTADVVSICESGPADMFPESASCRYDTLTDNDSLFTLRVEKGMGSFSFSNYSAYYHIDKITNEAITLKDLFYEGSSYSSVITNHIKKEMGARMAEDPTKSYEIDDFNNIDGNQNFYINAQNNLTIVFDEYEVAPGYMGIIEFSVPSSLLNAEGLLLRPYVFGL